jgi:hypothetical protein
MATGKQLLTVAEAHDHYIAACNASPMNAEARKDYTYAPCSLNNSDAQRLTNIVHNLDLLKDTNTLILTSTAENGYPHTRPKALVCLPAGFVASSTDSELKETLCHEAFHIDQRRFPMRWKEMCKAEGWTPLSVDDIPIRFRERCRINPDTFYDTPFWAWDTHYVPLPMFKRGFGVSLGNIVVEWLDLRTNAIFHSPPDSFKEKYGTPSQPEHPYEIYAVLFANYGITTHAALNEVLKQLTTK